MTSILKRFKITSLITALLASSIFTFSVAHAANPDSITASVDSAELGGEILFAINNQAGEDLYILPMNWYIEVHNEANVLVATSGVTADNTLGHIVSVGEGNYESIDSASGPSYPAAGTYTVSMKNDAGTTIDTDNFELTGPVQVESIAVTDRVRPGETVVVTVYDSNGASMDLPEGATLSAYSMVDGEVGKIVAMSTLEDPTVFDDINGDEYTMHPFDKTGTGVYLVPGAATMEVGTYEVELQLNGASLEQEEYRVATGTLVSVSVDRDEYAPGSTVDIILIADDGRGMNLPAGWSLGAHYLKGEDEDQVVIVGLSSVDEPTVFDQVDGTEETVYPIAIKANNTGRYQMTAPAHFDEYFVELHRAGETGTLVDTDNFFVVSPGQLGGGNDEDQGEAVERREFQTYSAEYKEYLAENLDRKKVLDLALDKEGKVVCTDLEEEYWAFEIITELLDMRVYPVERRNDEIVCRPQETVTRAEFLTWLLVAYYPEEVMNIAQVDLSNIPFSDLEADDPYAPYIMQAYEMGIVNGNADGTFRAHADINRAELFKILFQSIGAFDNTPGELAFLRANYGDRNPISLFEDIKDDKEWYYAYLYFASANGIIEGRLYGDVRRADMASPILYAEAAKMLLLSMKLEQ